jgi:23S rRNA-/tRNA-specific pseudouridylate synthase
VKGCHGGLQRRHGHGTVAQAEEVRGRQTGASDARRRGDGAQAITDYGTLGYAAQKLALLELRSLTGRMHQLHARCARGFGAH